MKGSATAGFSLIEVLVAIAIMGIVVAAVSLSVSPGEGRKVDEEVDRLANLFRLARNEAQLTGRRIEWAADSAGYRFTTDGAPRRPAPDDPLRPRPWPFPVRGIEAPTIRFGYEPLFEPAEIRLSMPGSSVRLLLDPLGNLRRAP